MGMVVEFNWFMVVANESKIIQENDLFYTVKSEKRIYPIGFKIPLIIKNVGCIGLIKISKTIIDTTNTTIYFDIIEKYDTNNVVSQHYYDRYLDFKNREKELNP